MCAKMYLYKTYELEYPLFSLNTATDTVHQELFYTLYLTFKFETLEIYNLITVAVFNKNEILKKID